jgi:hypothetical protein
MMRLFKVPRLQLTGDAAEPSSRPTWTMIDTGARPPERLRPIAAAAHPGRRRAALQPA